MKYLFNRKRDIEYNVFLYQNNSALETTETTEVVKEVQVEEEVFDYVDDLFYSRKIDDAGREAILQHLNQNAAALDLDTDLKLALDESKQVIKVYIEFFIEFPKNVERKI